jgi:hydroxyacylglutathione hydrolase
MAIQVDQFMCRSDNFGALVHDPATGDTVLIDAPEAAPILAAIERTGWKPRAIFTTHHHADHVEANLMLKQRFSLEIIGPAGEASKIPGIDRTVKGGDSIDFGKSKATVIDTPGHTAGHITFHFADDLIAFAGDTLFAIGCGRLLECKPPVMFESLNKLAALPNATRIYCGHEYTQSNARFALTVDPGNDALTKRAAQIDALRADGKATLPTTIGQELATNPFLRWADPGLRKTLGMEKAPDVEVFAEVRRRKDVF